MAAEREVARGEKQDFTLGPNEFGWVKDEGSGIVKTHTGPMSSNLSQSEEVVTYDVETRRFKTVNANSGKQLKIAVPEGYYCSMWNPSKERPRAREKDATPELEWGTRIMIQGPDLFALWPGQIANVIQGHRLREDEYLVVQVYDAKAALKSLEAPEARALFPRLADPPVKAGEETPAVDSRQYVTTGALFVIEGTKRSFFIPPTGFEVAQIDGNYVQKAVSLERLEYCLLVDRNGTKSYRQGPDVVFPKPTESFVTDGDKRKFRAFELGPKQGIQVKVIKGYQEDGKTFQVGDELFITGESHPIYFPREEHAFVKYGDRIVHSGIAVPAGEARYLMDRLKGTIPVVTGPQILLPDPRTQVIVQRRLSEEQCRLLYPGNKEAQLANGIEPEPEPVPVVAGASAAPAMAFNASSMDQLEGLAGGRRSALLRSAGFSPNQNYATRAAQTSTRFSGDALDREGQYQAPRSLVLDAKFDGAVKVSVWEGFALMLVAQSGGRRVIQGPQTAFLEFDEVPQVFRLSTGKPKNADKLHSDVYLRTRNNYVSDEVTAETEDFQTVKIQLVYRVDFEGEPERWFSISNYVKHLTDSMRTVIRERVKAESVRSFYRNSTRILQDLLRADDAGEPGILFSENGMRIKGIEVLKLEFDKEVRTLLERQQFAVLQRAVTLDDQLDAAKVQRQVLEVRGELDEAETNHALSVQENARARYEDELKLTSLRAEAEKEEEERQNALSKIKTLREVAAADTLREARQKDNELELQRHRGIVEQDLRRMAGEAEAAKTIAEAFSPQLIAALQAHGDRAQLAEIARSFSVQGSVHTLFGNSMHNVLAKALEGTTLGDRLNTALRMASSSSASASAE